MSDLNLTPEERDVVEAWARDRSGLGSRVGFYASVILPLVLFGVYGIWTRQWVALAVALIGLLIFLGWRISRELSQVSVHRSLFKKIVEHENGSARRA